MLTEEATAGVSFDQSMPGALKSPHSRTVVLSGNIDTSERSNWLIPEDNPGGQ